MKLPGQKDWRFAAPKNIVEGAEFKTRTPEENGATCLHFLRFIV